MAGDSRTKTTVSRGARCLRKLEPTPIRILGAFKTTWKISSNVHTIAGLNVRPLRLEDLASARPTILAAKRGAERCRARALRRLSSFVVFGYVLSRLGASLLRSRPFRERHGSPH